MTNIAVLGAGAGGLATTVELSQAGCSVRLWHRNPTRLEAYFSGPLHYSGVLGEGIAVPDLVTTDLAQALQGAAAAVVSLPAFLHESLFQDLAGLGCDLPMVLSPGHTGGALHLREVFRRLRTERPPVAELSTLPYVCRVQPEQALLVSGRAQHLHCGYLPGDERAAELAGQLFGCAMDFTDVLASSLCNVNLVLHPPGAVLAAAWVEATGGDFNFYVDAMTPGVGRVMDALDGERLAVGGALGHHLPPLAEEMALVGTVPPLPVPRPSTASLVRSGEANRTIKAPSSLAHRYYKEDFSHGLAPFLALATAADVATPVTRSLLGLGTALLGDDMPPVLDAEALGISGLGAHALVELARL